MALHQFAILDAYVGAKCKTQQEQSSNGMTGRGQLNIISFNLMTFVLRILLTVGIEYLCPKSGVG